MYGTIWALLPAMVAICMALLTKEVYSSLFFGIFAGAFWAVGFNPVDAFFILNILLLLSQTSWIRSAHRCVSLL